MCDVSAAPAVDNTQVDPIYVGHFFKHLDHVCAHLAGNVKSGRSPPSFVPPSAHWTSTEKDIFFHALAIHSRLRPDLIAEEIKTKTVVDVCLYIRSLDSGAHRIGPLLRKDFPIAMQVSDALVSLEEQKAHPLLVAEPLWESKALEEDRRLELEAREKAVRARKGEAQAQTNEEYRQDVKRRKKELKQWIEERKEEWKLEDTLRALDYATLRAMDRILREEDEARLHTDEVEMLQDDTAAGKDFEVDQSREGALESSTPAVYAPQPVNDSEQQLPTASDQSATATPFDEEMIDPLLRSHSPATHPVRPSVTEPTSSGVDERTDTVPVPAHTIPYVQFRPRTPPFRPASLPPEYTPSTDRASPVAFKLSVESQLAAAARRKLQKRFHMRKKRAESRGLSTVSTAIRLKVGRKRSQKVLKGPAAYSNQASRDSQNALGGDAANAVEGSQNGAGDRALSDFPPRKRGRRHHASGVTLPHKLLQKLRAVGLNADRLQGECVGVINLKGLIKLMRLYNRLHDVEATVPCQISSDVIKLLNAHALHFTMEAMHRVIDMREQERESKSHTKGWRLGKYDSVSQVHVEQALLLLGCKSVTKKEHFDGLLERLGLIEDDFDDVDPGSAEHGESSVEEYDYECSTDEATPDASDAEDDTPFDPHTFPLHRAILPPFVYLSAAEASASASEVPGSLDTVLYMPWPASSASAEPPLEEDLMSDSTDTDALVEDLLDEEQLDEHDQRVEEACEESLWIEFGSTPPPAEHPHPRKKRKRAADDDSEGESDA